MSKKIALAASLALSGLILAAAPARAQTDLSAYADANGYLNMMKLTCAQLAGTYQEDANMLAVWYSGYYNGIDKKSSINIPRVKEGIHQLIVYCKAHPDELIDHGVNVLLKAEKANKQ